MILLFFVDSGSIWWSDDANRWCVPNMASDRSVVLRTQNLNYKLQERRPLQFNAYFGMKSIWSAMGAVSFGVMFAGMAPFQWSRNLMLNVSKQ